MTVTVCEIDDMHAITSGKDELVFGDYLSLTVQKGSGTVMTLGCIRINA